MADLATSVTHINDSKVKSNASDPPSEVRNLQSGARVSFASLVSKPRVRPRFSEIVIPNRQYGFKDGIPTVSFTAQEYQAATERFKFTLIAKFQSGRPPLNEIRKFFAENWRITGRGAVSTNWDDKHVVIILDSEEDVTVALTWPHRKVGHTFFRLFRWSCDYNPKKEDTTVTKWIRLPGFPMELFERGFIKAIVSPFATFLDIDDRTKELSSLTFARACVEIDVLQQIPNCVRVQLPNNKVFYQDIIVEGGLSYCSKCKIHGHEYSNCRKRNDISQNKATNPKEIGAKNSIPKDNDRQNLGNKKDGKKEVANSEDWQKPKRTAKMIYRAKDTHEGVNNKENITISAQAEIDPGVVQTINEEVENVEVENVEVNNDKAMIVYQGNECNVTQFDNSSSQAREKINEELPKENVDDEGEGEQDKKDHRALMIEAPLDSKKVKENRLVNFKTKHKHSSSPPRTRSRCKATEQPNNSKSKTTTKLTEQQIADALRYVSNPLNGPQDYPPSLAK